MDQENVRGGGQRRGDDVGSVSTQEKYDRLVKYANKDTSDGVQIGQDLLGLADPGRLLVGDVAPRGANGKRHYVRLTPSVFLFTLAKCPCVATA